MANDKILEVKDLSVSFNTYAGEVKAVRGVSFELNRGETLAFVGESGCGKTVTAKSILRLLKPPFAVIKEGSQITCDGKDVLALNKKELCEFRGDEVSMIFQDPMTSLNPTMTVAHPSPSEQKRGEGRSNPYAEDGKHPKRGKTCGQLSA